MKLFAHTQMLFYLIPALLTLGVVLWLGKRFTRHYASRLFGPEAYAKLTSPLLPVSRWRTVCLFGTVFFLFLALAGPQWGIEITEAQGNFAQTVFAVDVSSSMRAQDKAPNRLENAKQMIRLLVSHLKEERIGIIAFTSQAFIQCPITTDTQALDYFINALQPDMLPVPGTSLAAPVRLAARMLASYPGQKALILLTDGEDHTPEELAAAKQIAQENGIRIIAVGIGSAEGSLIPQRLDASGRVAEYKKDKAGKTVLSKLDEEALISLAQATGGTYISYTSAVQVARQVENALLGLDKTTARTGSHAVYKNRYMFPLGLAILCFGAYLLWPQRRIKKVK